MRTLPLIWVCFSICCFCNAQETSKSLHQSIAKNSLFGEFMGNAGNYSINYDRILINKEKWKFTGRLGFSFFYYRQDKYSRFAIPSEFCFLIGKSKHFFETGSGVMYEVYTIPKAYESNIEVRHYSYLFTRFGYRYQRPQGGLFLKVALNVLFPMTKNSRYLFLYSEYVWVWGGVGIGYTFKQRKSK